MTSVVDLAKLANGVYDDEQAVGEWLRYGLPFTTEGSGYKSALYQSRMSGDYALAIAGTNPTELDDLRSDVQLFLGRMPDQYRVAKTAYNAALQLTGAILGFYLTGHSLGGGLASMLGKEYGNPLVTFNAPGMARAFASMQRNDPSVGSVRDDERKVLHLCAVFDVVSRGTGAHMGERGSVQRVRTGAAGMRSVAVGVVGTILTGGNVLAGGAIAGGYTALRAHSMSRMVTAIENKREYQEPLGWL